CDRARPGLVRRDPRPLRGVRAVRPRRRTMSGRPPKSLAQLVRNGSFRARRAQHRALLAGPDLPYPGFALLQTRFRQATSEPERRALALEFEQAVRLVHAEAEIEQAEGRGRSLEAELAELGRAGSLVRLMRF